MNDTAQTTALEPRQSGSTVIESGAVKPSYAGSLTRAVAAVMATVKRLEKSDDNKFANYKFTSVDDFKDALRPVMAENGLMVGISQVHFSMFEGGKGKDSLHCQFGFELWLEHTSGEVGQREGVTVPLPYTGAQTSGIAKSYAIKEYLKGKFLQSSGDLAEDADNYAMDVKFSKAQARTFFDGFVDDLRGIASTGGDPDLKTWSEKNSVLLQAMPSDWSVELRHEYKQAQLGILARERGEEIENLLPDMQAWREGFENQLAGIDNEADLEAVWVEHEDTIETLNSTDRAWANRIYGERLEAVQK